MSKILSTYKPEEAKLLLLSSPCLVGTNNKKLAHPGELNWLSRAGKPKTEPSTPALIILSKSSQAFELVDLHFEIPCHMLSASSIQHLMSFSDFVIHL